jgi:hypothetical protein
MLFRLTKGGGECCGRRRVVMLTDDLTEDRHTKGGKERT